ncbi:crossover junction endodeoxyribonuclease RuvC [Longibacter salinarum]|uniref:Crossover junction endodeoxyribonuclease RuvC n=1 Tax=Longibacter salinarum TaxID=1850348 RepID=A0A2A8CUV1_9BACT|nr:crossover junction endodeoxyribonuclease RuvC [Longibacter salinarum]PEN12240.1 crossover junction endodeoxyribonuclease RuvC [Longibacter salinarum]
MLILGIDPGSRVTGYGIIDASSGDETPVAFGTVRLDTSDSHPDRLKEIFDALTDLICEHTPDALAIEMPVYGQNPQSMLKLGRAQAAAMLAGLNQDLSVAQYTPKEIKKSVTGNGNASKTQVQYMVRSILNLEKGTSGFTHDAADALAVALCHSNRGSHGETQSYTGWASFVANNPDRVSE